MTSVRKDNSKLNSDLAAGADLSSAQFCAVKISAGAVVLASTAGERAWGILQNKPTSGQQAVVCVEGPTKIKASGTVTQGAYGTPAVTTGQLKDHGAVTDYDLVEFYEGGANNQIVRGAVIKAGRESNI